jgi:hypothetical protein
MRLWTWQRTGVFPYGREKLDSLKYSYYLNDSDVDASVRLRRATAYKKLWGLLSTDQVMWCFTNEKEAVEAAGREWCKDCVLWEFDVPLEEVKLVCTVGWDLLVQGGCSTPSELVECFRQLQGFYQKNGKPYFRDLFDKDFCAYWRGRSESELWEALFVSRDCGGCAQPLAFHPVDKAVRHDRSDRTW